MDPLSVILIVLLAFAATFIQRVTGFGYGILFMSAAPYLMPSYGEATALSGMLALVCALGTGITLVKYIPWKKLIPILLTFLVVSFFSVRAVKSVDAAMIKKILGGVLVAVSIFFWFFKDRIHLKPSIPVQVSMGTISGVMGGLFGMQGPPAVIYFISSTSTKEEYMAVTQAYFLIGNVMMTLYRAGNGFVTATVGKTFAIGVVAVLGGLWLGSKVYSRMPVGLIRKFVYVFIGIAGIMALI